ncbi:MAG: hypothetical protein V4687_15960 [Bacteroidota bacterium]
MSIKFGSIDYFELLSLRDKLQSRHFDKLGLDNLDKLRNECCMKIESIHYEHNQSKQPNNK